MPEPYQLHDSIGYQSTLFSRICERRFERALTPLGLTRVSWCVLLAVGQEGCKTPSGIAAFIGIDRTATSRALRRLEEGGMISRCGGKNDRRTTEVSITEAGRSRLDLATKAARENADYYNAKLSWYEQDMLASITKKLMQGEARDVSGL